MPIDASLVPPEETLRLRDSIGISGDAGSSWTPGTAAATDSYLLRGDGHVAGSDLRVGVGPDCLRVASIPGIAPSNESPFFPRARRSDTTAVDPTEARKEFNTL